MNFLVYFLKLTEYTVPFGWEHTIEPLLPKGFKKDSIGNYYYQVGESKTLFTSHLDTASKERQKINHVVEDKIVKTDGTTILGADNKAGCLVLFYLIEKRIPGTYYFFLGEESAVHGNYPYGSLLSIQEEENKFRKFDRVISFDRKEKGQLITRQLGQKCCSREFADELISRFDSLGLKYKKDDTGYYSDSAFFVNLVPEIVNLSVGVYNEHLTTEWVDLAYVEKVAKAAAEIDWETLPTVRKPNNNYIIDPREDVEAAPNDGDQLLFKKIFELLDDLYFVCHEFRSYKNYLHHFRSGRKYHFTKWHEDEHLIISISNGVITCNEDEFDSFESFARGIGVQKMTPSVFAKIIIDEFRKTDNKLTDAKFNYLSTLKGVSFDDLQSSLKNLGFEIEKIGKGYQLNNLSYLEKKFESFLNKIKLK